MKKVQKMRLEELKEIREGLKKERARKISIIEGGFASVAGGTGSSYVSPFAIAIGASNAQIGILSSISGVISPLSQMYGARLIERDTRKKIVVRYVFLEALMWLSIFAVALLAWRGVIDSLPLVLIVLYSLMTLVGALAAPSWFSWMGDLVEEDNRGRYFSRRNKICGAVSLFSMLLAAFFLDYFKTRGIVLVGFACLFLIASVARMISSYFFKKQYEPKLKLRRGYYFTAWSFIKRIADNNFGRFTIFVSLMRLATFIAAPFFAVYMLRDIGLSYFWFTIISISAPVFTLLSLGFWGRFADRYGNRNLIKASLFLLPIIPFLWLVSRNPFYLTIVPELVSGLGWAAFNLGVNDFIYDSVSPERRALCSAYHNLIAGIGIIIGGIIGSLLIKILATSFINVFLLIFAVSGIARIGVAVFCLPHIKEPRKIRKSKSPLAAALFRETRMLHTNRLPHHPPAFFSRLPKPRRK